MTDQGALVTGNQTADATFDNFSIVAAIPEPSTYALLAGLGALGLVMLRRRLSMASGGRKDDIGDGERFSNLRKD